MSSTTNNKSSNKALFIIIAVIFLILIIGIVAFCLFVVINLNLQNKSISFSSSNSCTLNSPNSQVADSSVVQNGDGFKFNYPKTWTLNTSPEPLPIQGLKNEVSVSFLKGLQIAGVSVITSTDPNAFSGNADLYKNFDNSAKQVFEIFDASPQIQASNLADAKLGNTKAKSFDFTITDEQSGFTLPGKATFTICNQKLYAIQTVYNDQAGSEAEFAYRAAVDSFVFTK